MEPRSPDRLSIETQLAHGYRAVSHILLTGNGELPLPEHSADAWTRRAPVGPWRSTLKRLAIRYRKPYVARHTSVSWNLMVGHNPLWVAKQHGHRIATMFSVYAAWTEGAREEDIAAIRKAMNGGGPSPCSPHLNRAPRHPKPSPTSRARPLPGDITMRVEGSALPNEAPRDDGSETSFASEFAGSAALLVANYLKPMKKIGGADGDRSTDVRH